MRQVVIVGELNVDFILHNYQAFPVPGREVLVDDFRTVLGSASAICAVGLARLGVPSRSSAASAATSGVISASTRCAAKAWTSAASHVTRR